MKIEDLQANARRASALLKAMCNERRLLILCHLSQGERSVGELEDLVGLSQSALSQHLARLRNDNLVRTRRSAQNIYYSLNGHEAQTIMTTLHGLYCTPAAEDADGEERGGDQTTDRSDLRAAAAG
ncbi:DNA-binding transcriptional ArsR family regulator [Azospirillum lipoferum]|uniref:Helix-turn-helix transcriptional regulator n=1 Tax=Azospirillum lipoferum TaxID=193 RepID=A0A5A9GIF7_AZOLI|nr:MULTISPECIES: metalloregulator ArsR/SmtB family transcription factor [Azospirillum]KAA0594146.1 helix-turn-helix transcriptional regulator [Azospirillum lipoferum]MCP1612641.1 DNA-binding transcriptional ArsR family regulator [Azospirillum lipoferum]MDW5531577.1 metalloregulator ArsR/SmtB family transcription factor [Azospirillum sp. NL1]